MDEERARRETVGDGRRETRHASDSLDLTTVFNYLLGGPEPKENMLRYF